MKRKKVDFVDRLKPDRNRSERIMWVGERELGWSWGMQGKNARSDGPLKDDIET